MLMKTRTAMKKTHLQVLEGGRVLPVSRMRRILLDAYVTDTRLMGVLAVVVHWSVASPEADGNDPDSWEDVYQFIYIDCEEAGLETCQLVRGRDIEEEAKRIEEALVCGLGAQKLELDERQLRLLLQNWARFNERHGLPLPQRQDAYDFLLEPVIDADESEQKDLMRLLCPPIRTDEQVVNYFLMRCFGRDHEGALYLTEAFDPDSGARHEGCVVYPVPSGARPQESFRLDLYDDYLKATFCRNRITQLRDYPDGSMEYRCESLIEMDGSYDIAVSTVTVRNLKVTGFTRCGSMPVTSTEAALILRKNEYITLYDVFLSEDEMEDNIDEFTLGFHTTMSEYANGRLFMSFWQNNDHVNSREFLLSNDVRGLYFLTDGGQLLLCAYSPQDVLFLERTIARSPLAPYLIPSGRFNFVPGHGRSPAGALVFHEPIMYEFMNSSFERFEDFLQALRQQ